MITWGSICFTQYFVGSRNTLAIFKNPPPVTLRLDREYEIHLDRPRSIRLLIKTGLVSLANFSIKIAEQGGLGLIRSAFTFSLARQADKKLAADGMLGKLDAETAYEMTLPYSGNVSGKVATLVIHSQYYIGGNLCSMTQSVETDLSLPLSVNVQDFFRSDR